MKAISLWQPWATLWVLQIKKDETRAWPFPHWHYGPVAIHAAKKKINLWNDIAEHYLDGILKALNKAGLDHDDLPRGALIGVCDSIRSAPILTHQQDDLEEMLGDWTINSGRHSWTPKNMRALKAPIPFIGRQGLFSVDDHIIYGGPPKHTGHHQLKLF
jgi:hypothetical protein